MKNTEWKVPEISLLLDRLTSCSESSEDQQDRDCAAAAKEIHRLRGEYCRVSAEVERMKPVYQAACNLVEDDGSISSLMREVEKTVKNSASGSPKREYVAEGNRALEDAGIAPIDEFSQTAADSSQKTYPCGHTGGATRKFDEPDFRCDECGKPVPDPWDDSRQPIVTGIDFGSDESVTTYRCCGCGSIMQTLEEADQHDCADSEPTPVCTCRGSIRSPACHFHGDDARDESGQTEDAQ